MATQLKKYSVQTSSSGTRMKSVPHLEARSAFVCSKDRRKASPILMWLACALTYGAELPTDDIGTIAAFDDFDIVGRPRIPGSWEGREDE